MNTNYRILVVDDEEDLCDILKFNLENEGYEVETANSAEEALKMDLTKFHLLLLDVMMGEISGFKMAKMLKQVRETRDIPIIFLRRVIRRTMPSPDSLWGRTTIFPNPFPCAKCR